MDYHNDKTIDLTPDATGGDSNGLDTTLSDGRTNEAFKAELARALQIVAGHERDRLVATIGAEAARQVERTRTRGSVESGELRRGAEDDAAAIRAWSKAEIDKIRSEAARRAQQREADLLDVLRRHEAIIDVEVAAVATAVTQYESTLVGFFEDMTTSMDLGHIVRQSDLIPLPPNLEMVRADARAETALQLAEMDGAPAVETTEATVDGADAPTGETAEPTDGPGVGVMDPDAIGATADMPEAETIATTDAADQPAAVEEPAVAEEPAAVEEPAVAEEPAAIADEVVPAPEEPVAVANANGTAGHENPATRFLRSLGWTPASTDGPGGQPGQPT